MLWVLIVNKLIRNQDMVFLENQKIKDCEKVENHNLLLIILFIWGVHNEHDDAVHEDNVPTGGGEHGE